MGKAITRREFLESDAAVPIRKALEDIALDPQFNTKATYTTQSVDSLTFVKKHMQYLGDHPRLNPAQYIANIRMMTRIR